MVKTNMERKIKQSIIGGMLATIMMSLFMFLVTFLGFPKMNPPAMLSVMLQVPLIVGWIMHFLIGFIFALAYTFLLYNPLSKLNGIFIRGLIFGIVVFIFAQIAFAMMGAVMVNMPPPEGNMILMMIGSLLAHMTYGIGVSAFVKVQ
jgi:uncharacterized membrane protein YagU involved in acid resistance